MFLALKMRLFGKKIRRKVLYVSIGGGGVGWVGVGRGGEVSGLGLTPKFYHFFVPFPYLEIMIFCHIGENVFPPSMSRKRKSGRDHFGQFQGRKAMARNNTQQLEM